MTHIASPQNPRLKSVKRLHTTRERERTGRFLVEGEDLIVAAARVGRAPVEGYRVAGTALGDETFLDVHHEALAAVSTLGSGTRVIGVYEQLWAPTAKGPLCLYLHGVKDPGNVGAALRSAHAFGASAVAFGPGCADPHSPKAVRASMGAIFAVDIARVGEVGELPGERIALLADAREDLRGPSDRDGKDGRRGDPGNENSEALAGTAEAVTLLVGAEREGLPPEVVAACERTAAIPIATHSLNAAMAATVALYEMTRRPSRVTAS